MNPWQLKVCDPSGETRSFSIHGSVTLGRSINSTIPLRDPTAPPDAAILWPSTSSSDSPFWIKVPPHSPPILLGDLAVREAQLVRGIQLRIGETQLILENTSPQQNLPAFPGGVQPWLTSSELGRQVLWMAKKASTTSLSIYLGGETGTGKEVLSHLIHAWSSRKSGPFVPLHCGALPLSLAESELFGHVKGAFTGAVTHRPGALMQAHGGTLFLDEVGDLPLDIQVKLLRFLENGEIRPVGADRPSRADVRIICATHHPLQKLVSEGKFRQDLYFRIASVPIQIPALKNRPEDIELLAHKFSKELNRQLSPRALQRLKAYSWPGNVRELRHAIERASGLSGAFSQILHEIDFEFLWGSQCIQRTSNSPLDSPILSLREMEKLLLIKALKLTYGNRAEAARLLGIARSTLFEMLKRYKIQGPRKQEHFINSLQ